MRLPADLLHELARHVERRVGDEMHDRIALVAHAQKGDLGRQLSEDARGVSSPLALEAQKPRRRKLRAVAGALNVVETRVEKAHPHLLARQLKLLAERDGEAAREDLAIAAHRGRRIDDQVVEAPRLVGRLFACVKEKLAVDHPASELLLVPRQLGQHHRVDRPLAADARVPVDGVRTGRLRAVGLEDARDELEREVHDVVGRRARQRGEEIDVRERARGRGLRAEHAEQAQRVEIERVGQRQDVQARPRERVERGDLVRAGHGREEPRQLRLEVPHELRIVRQRLRPGRSLRRPSDGRGQQARQHDDDQVVPQLHRRRPRRRLAARDLLDDLAVHPPRARPASAPRAMTASAPGRGASSICSCGAP